MPGQEERSEPRKESPLGTGEKVEKRQRKGFPGYKQKEEEEETLRSRNLTGSIAFTESQSLPTRFSIFSASTCSWHASWSAGLLKMRLRDHPETLVTNC